MNWLKELFKTAEQKAIDKAAYDESIRREYDDERKREEVALAVEAERLRKEIEENILREKMESSTPWYEPIIGAEDATHISERYRWNQAFIKDLIKKGHRGDSDSELFISYLSRQEEEERQRIVAEEREKKLRSSEPWVEVIGENIDEDGRIELQLDWNAAFVKYLRLNGFRGATDDILVQSWLAALEKDTSAGEYN